jgi:hypothetical protein
MHGSKAGCRLSHVSRQANRSIAVHRASQALLIKKEGRRRDKIVVPRGRRTARKLVL